MKIFQRIIRFFWHVLTFWIPRKKKGFKKPEIVRYDNNPIISPKNQNDWESEGTFNPAAVLIDGRVHLLYRAIGRDGVSRIGYASSSDGLNFDERIKTPIFSMLNLRSYQLPNKVYRYDPVMYPSGGGWGGSEDPRMVMIENNIYFTFNAFDGWDFIRTAVTSLNKNDFLSKKWNWKQPLLISPEGERHKNWVLFPEKIKGRFAILHSIFGEKEDQVRIEYVDSMETLKKRKFKSPDPQLMPNQEIAWHYRMRSAGPPPIKTDSGWLVFYHAIEESEQDRYKVGVMLLDLEDPTKIIIRSKLPILAPDMDYENDGKYGVVYVCGALIKDGKLFLYYGAGDKHTAVAFAELDKFLDDLKEGSKPSISFKKILFG